MIRSIGINRLQTFKLAVTILLFVTVGMNLLFAASNKERENFRLASTYERQGEYSMAESLYVDLYTKAPENYNYYNKYKRVLILQRKFDSVKPLLEERYQDNKKDQYNRLELSILYFALGEKKKARSHWEVLFGPQHIKSQRSFSNNVYNKVLEYRLGGSFYEIVDELRTISNNDDLLVRYNFRIALRYRNWEQAVKEMIHVIENNPNNLSYIRAELFRQDPNSILYRLAINSLQKNKLVEAKVLLADVYLHLRDHSKALSALDGLNENPKIQSALLKLANTLLKNGQHVLAYQAAERALIYSRSPIQSTSMQFVMAEALREQFIANNTVETLIPRPFASKFTDLPVQSFKESDIALIENAGAIYDSLSQGRGDIAEKAGLAMVNIEHSVYRDIDAALQRAENMLVEISIANRVNLLDIMAHLYMAKGDMQSARELALGAAEKYSLMVHEEDRLLVTELHTAIVAGESDSLNKKLDLLFSLLPNDDPFYNDILNYAAFVSVLAKDSLRQAEWQEAEQALMMQDPAKAADIYGPLTESGSEAEYIYALRYLDCLHALKDKETEREFWMNNYERSAQYEMSDYFMLAYAAFLEKDEKNEKAIDIYEEFLLSYQDSMYFERVREYLRRLKS